MAKKLEKNKEYFDRIKAGKIKPLYVPEILEAAAHYKKVEDKIEVLLNNDCPAIREVLRLAYDPDVEFTIGHKEAKKIEYHHMDVPDYDQAAGTLHTEWKRLKYITTDSAFNMPKTKQMNLLAQIFTILHQPEIDLIRAMIKGRNLPYEGITEKVTRRCWPHIFKNVEIYDEKTKKWNKEGESNEGE